MTSYTDVRVDSERAPSSKGESAKRQVFGRASLLPTMTAALPKPPTFVQQ